MNKTLYKIFKWNINELILNTIGVIIFSFAINFFIEPTNLYSGGVFGLAQLLNKLIDYLFNITMNMTSIIYFLINVPLFILAFFKISKSFCCRTIYTIIVQTIALLIIPIPDKMIVEEIITNVLIGGTLTGIGCALILSSTGSTGGTDIVGIVLSNKYKKVSVGRNAIAFNMIIFGISGLAYGLSTMIYSILYSIIENISLDKLHEQNISSSAFIFSKNKPTKLLKFIKDDLQRGATWWKGTGHNQTETYITYVVLTRYELHKLEKYIKVTNADVFLTKSDFVGVEGNFEKRLSK
ncbi:MAG: YitT family protein [Bacilli bacterium]|nr:YitT family protein [Bacilli bacterium]